MKPTSYLLACAIICGFTAIALWTSVLVLPFVSPELFLAILFAEGNLTVLASLAVPDDSDDHIQSGERRGKN